MRDGLSRGLLETLLCLFGLALVVLDSTVPAVENGFAAGMALIGASATSYGLRSTRPGDDKPSPPSTEDSP